MKNNETSTLQDSVIGTPKKRADAFADRHKLGRPAIVGPPVLLADGFTSIDVDGRRLAIVGMVLIGLVMLSATQSLWWALVPLMAGWTVWLATSWVLATFDMKLSLSGGPLVAQIIVLTMPAASHLAIHYRDERRTRTRRAGRLEDHAGRRLQPDPLVRRDRGDRLRSPGDQQRRADPAIRLDHGPYARSWPPSW